LDDFHLQENGQSLNSKLKDWFLARQEKGDGVEIARFGLEGGSFEIFEN